MNPELYTDEYRNFKFLKSSPEEVEFYKNNRTMANLIQPWDSQFDPKFNWATRIEFIEQLLDLRYDSVYIVFAALLGNRNIYEDASIFSIENPVILDSNPISNPHAREVTIDDFPILAFWGDYCLMSGRAITFNGIDTSGRIFDLYSLPIYQGTKSHYTEMFYDRYEAEKYKRALTDMLRNKSNAISSFTRQL